MRRCRRCRPAGRRPARGGRRTWSAPLGRAGFGVQVALGQDDRVDVEHATRRQPDPLAAGGGGWPTSPVGIGAVAVVRVGQVDGAVGVDVDPDGRRELGDDPVQHRREIAALHRPGGERAGVHIGHRGADLGVGEQRRPARPHPLPQRRPGARRTVHGDGPVRKEGDVGGGRVHPQQRRLAAPPDPAAARRVGVDQVDVQAGVGGVRRQPLEDPQSARTGTDDRDRPAGPPGDGRVVETARRPPADAASHPDPSCHRGPLLARPDGRLAEQRPAGARRFQAGRSGSGGVHPVLAGTHGVPRGRRPGH